MLGSPKYNEKTEEHIRVKKAICPKDGTIFDFMIRPPNDESEVVKSPLLDVPEPEVKRFPVENSDIVSETTEAEFEVVETLLKEAGIEGYNLSYPSDNFPDKFPLSRTSHHTVHYVIGSIVMKMPISDEIKNLIAFSVTVPIKINSLGREILH